MLVQLKRRSHALMVVDWVSIGGSLAFAGRQEATIDEMQPNDWSLEGRLLYYAGMM